METLKISIFDTAAAMSAYKTGSAQMQQANV